MLDLAGVMSSLSWYLRTVEAEEVEALVDMDDSGLLLRQLQPAFGEKLHHPRA